LHGGDGESSCGSCDTPRNYAGIQAEILGIKSQDELDGSFPEEKMRELFGKDPLADKVDSFTEFPVLGRIGIICYQYRKPFPPALGKVSGERECENQREVTGPAVKRFQEQYRELCKKYGGEYPKREE